MDSENLGSLIRLSVSDGQKTDSSKVVSVMLPYIQFVVYFSRTTSQKVKFCKIKSVTHDKKTREKYRGKFNNASALGRSFY